MSQMPKEGAFLAIFHGKNAETFAWNEKGQLEKFVYLGMGKHEWQIVSDEIVREMNLNPNIEFRPH